jgi:trk system potassium uptake protein TrkH
MAEAVFESVSGVTTTGSTVLVGLDDMSRGVLLWRGITQCIGGIGIIAFAMIILPFLHIGGMQLFKAESSDRSDKIMPRTNDVIWSLVYVYVALITACFIVYHLLGMSKFDAIVHAMATISTGGFANYDASFGHFDNYALHISGALFMFLGGMPFILFVKYVNRGEFEFFKDSQVRTYTGFVVILTAMVTWYLWQNDTYTLAESFKYALFNIVSVITTTGFATTDYTLWGAFPVGVFFFLTYVGATAGSTAGGIKMLRINIAYEVVNRHFKTLIYPNGAFGAKYQGKPITNDVIEGVITFLFLYVLTNVVISVALTMTGLDILTSVTAAATAIANVGPGLGNIVGPAGNFSSLSDNAKWILSLGMLLGRLEFMTILVIFTPAFWKD